MTVVDGSSTYGAIPAQGSAAGDTFLFTVPTNAMCGQSLQFTLATASTLGAGSLNIVLRVGPLKPAHPAMPADNETAMCLPCPCTFSRGRGSLPVLHFCGGLNP